MIAHAHGDVAVSGISHRRGFRKSLIADLSGRRIQRGVVDFRHVIENDVYFPVARRYADGMQLGSVEIVDERTRRHRRKRTRFTFGKDDCLCIQIDGNARIIIGVPPREHILRRRCAREVIFHGKIRFRSRIAENKVPLRIELFRICSRRVKFGKRGRYAALQVCRSGHLSTVEQQAVYSQTPVGAAGGIEHMVHEIIRIHIRPHYRGRMPDAFQSAFRFQNHGIIRRPREGIPVDTARRGGEGIRRGIGDTITV